MYSRFLLFGKLSLLVIFKMTTFTPESLLEKFKSLKSAIFGQNLTLNFAKEVEDKIISTGGTSKAVYRCHFISGRTTIQLTAWEKEVEKTKAVLKPNGTALAEGTVCLFLY
jgi:hypothetical protein